MSIEPVKDYQQAAKVLRDTNLRQGLYDEGAVLMEGVLVNLHGEKHRARRGLENKGFRRGFFSHYEKDVFPKTLALTIDQFVSNGGGDLVEFGFRALINLTCDFAGVDRPQASQSETDRLLSLMRAFALGTTLAHSKDDRDKVRQQVSEALSAFDVEFLQPSVERRMSLIRQVEARGGEEQDLPRDVLTVLLRNEDQIELDDAQLVREMAFFVVAGAQTSIHSLVHVMHEIFTWSDNRSERIETLRTDPMLVQRCVHESARLHPSSPVAVRRAECPVLLPTEQRVETDEQVTIDLQSANQDEKIFGSRASEFDPNRQFDKGISPYGLSFGLGMHACIGRTLAAGVTPKPDTDPVDHQYGIIALIASALLKNGVRPDPEQPAEVDAKTERPNWGRYPVLLGSNPSSNPH